MARVTAEDALEIIRNRFVLAILTGKRARQLYNGAPSTVPETGNKFVVTALREIEAHTVREANAEETAILKLRAEENLANEKPAYNSTNKY